MSQFRKYVNFNLHKIKEGLLTLNFDTSADGRVLRNHAMGK